jgi:tripartite-type tricarboxylate transporter receptor subunit TctC
MNDLVAGQVNVAFDPLSSSLPFIKSGQLRALAVTSEKRAPWAAEVPTLNEAGVTGYEASTYVALLAPAGTPKPIIAKLNAAAARALETTAVAESFANFATVPLGGTPEQLADYIQRDLNKWKKVIKQSNIKIE